MLPSRGWVLWWLLAQITWVVVQAESENLRGYALQFQGMCTIAGIANGVFNFTETAFDGLKDKATIATWVKFSPTKIGHQSLFRFASKSNNYVVDIQMIDAMLMFRDKLNVFPWKADNLVESERWYHFVLTLDGTQAKGYLDGVLIDEDTVENMSIVQQDLTFYAGSILYSGGPIDKAVRNNLAAPFKGALDDLMVWKKVFRPEEVPALMYMDVDLDNVPDELVMYYTFDAGHCSDASSAFGLLDPSCSLSGDHRIKNYGSAGPGYDLLNGQLNDDYGYGTAYLEKTDTKKNYIRFDRGGLAISTVPRNSTSQLFSKHSPIVRHATSLETLVFHIPAGTTVQDAPSVGTLLKASDDQALVGTDLSNETAVKFQTPADFSTPVWFRLEGGDGMTQEVHIWPHEPPSFSNIVPQSRVVTLKTFAGESMDLQLGQFFRSVTGAKADAIIATTVSNGNLEEIYPVLSSQTFFSFQETGRIMQDGDRLLYENGLMLRYEPANMFAGVDEFEVQFTLPDVGLESDSLKIRIEVEAIDEQPVVHGSQAQVTEDTFLNGTWIDLHASDKNELYSLSIVISEIPTKGTLYIEDEDGKMLPVLAPYNIYDVGQAIEQYPEEVVGFSSFISLGPDTNYHVMNVIGRPVCFTKGRMLSNECEDQRLDDPDFDPYPGMRILLDRYRGERNETLLVFIIEQVHANETYTAKALPTYRYLDGTKTPTPCVMIGPIYPDDCSTEEAATLGQQGLILYNVSKSDFTMLQGVWVPAKQSLSSGYVSLGERGIMYGPQFGFEYSQEENYAKHQFTEYVEVKFAKRVFPVGVEVGMPRGGGAVVNVKAWNPVRQEWQFMYRGKVQADKYSETNGKGFYFVFDEEICRPPFRTDTIRVELDTSEETGIPDWNFVDYIKLIGSPNMQSGLLRDSKSPRVFYSPKKDAFGEDSFSFKASDCGGDPIRESAPATVEIDVLPAMDEPVLNVFPAQPLMFCESPRFTNTLNQAVGSISIELRPYDVDGDSLSLKISQFPEHGSLWYDQQQLGPDNNHLEISDQGEVWVDEHGYFHAKATVVYMANCRELSSSTFDSFKVLVRDETGKSTEQVVRVSVFQENKQFAKQSTVSICLAAFGLSFATVLLCLIWVILFRGSVVVKAAQLDFLLLVIFGSALSSTTIYFVTMDDRTSEEEANLGCRMSVWVYCIGFMATIAPLAMKLFRANILFDLTFGLRFNFGTAEEKKRSKRLVSKQHLYKITFAVIGVDVLLCTAWSLADPLTYQRQVMARDPVFDYPVQSYGMCWSAYTKTFVFLIFAFHLLILLFVTYIATNSLHISSAFTEAKSIRFSLFSSLQVLLLSVPIMIVTSDNADSVMLTRCGAVFLNDVSILLMIFVPKIFAQLSPDKSGFHEGAGGDIFTRTLHSSTAADKAGPSQSLRSHGASVVPLENSAATESASFAHDVSK